MDSAKEKQPFYCTAPCDKYAVSWWPILPIRKCKDKSEWQDAIVSISSFLMHLSLWIISLALSSRAYDMIDEDGDPCAFVTLLVIAFSFLSATIFFAVVILVYNFAFMCYYDVSMKDEFDNVRPFASAALACSHIAFQMGKLSLVQILLKWANTQTNATTLFIAASNKNEDVLLYGSLAFAFGYLARQRLMINILSYGLLDDDFKKEHAYAFDR